MMTRVSPVTYGGAACVTDDPIHARADGVDVDALGACAIGGNHAGVEALAGEPAIKTLSTGLRMADDAVGATSSTRTPGTRAWAAT